MSLCFLAKYKILYVLHPIKLQVVTQIPYILEPNALWFHTLARNPYSFLIIACSLPSAPDIRRYSLEHELLTPPRFPAPTLIWHLDLEGIHTCM